MSSDLTKAEESELPDDVKAIISEAQSKRRLFKKHLNLYFGFTISSAPLVTLLIFVSNSLFVRMFSVCVVAIVAWTGIFYYFAQKKKGVYGIQASALKRLASTNDKRLIGVLLDSASYLRVNHPYPRSQDLLQPLLLQIDSDDSHLLTGEQKSMLIHRMHNSDLEFTLTILSVLGKIGDAKHSLVVFS